MNIDQVNAWNAIEAERIHYDPYWKDGKFQIPKHYMYA